MERESPFSSEFLDILYLDAQTVRVIGLIVRVFAFMC